MKTRIYASISVMFLIALFNNVIAQSANKTLSNLTSPTAVNVNLLPGHNNKFNLGSPGKQWNNLYLNGDLYLQENRFISDAGISSNTFVGSFAGYLNTDGSSNSYFGERSGYANTTGNYNSFFGFNAGISNTGDYNAFFGSKAGLNNTSAGENAFFGESAGFNNTTGDNNAFFGESAGFFNTEGSNNSFFGQGAGSGNSLGKANSFFGEAAGANTTTGNRNTCVGFHSGNTIASGSSNTILGYGADVKGGGYSNATAIGNLTVVGASNHIHIGNSSVTSIGGQVSWTSFSDERIKHNIKENVPGLAFINLLRPVTYNFDIDKQNLLTGAKDLTQWDGKYDIQKISFTGFIAQDVEAAAKKINYDFSGVDAPQNTDDVYGLRYSDFVVPLVKAVQELSKMNDEKDSAIQQQNIKIIDLQDQIDKLKAMIALNQPAIVSSASLQQNIPNPFTNTTTISYTLPQTSSSAKIIITDTRGNILKQLNLSGSKGSVNVDASTLSPGAYQYLLYVDGRLIDSKQMQLLN